MYFTVKALHIQDAHERDLMESFYISKEGLEKLRADVDLHMNVKRREIAAAIEHARAFGDLRENAEYKAAKERQALNEIRITELAHRLQAARIIDEKDIPIGKVAIGSIVKMYDMRYNEEIEYKLVSEVEANVDEDRISVTSPIGKALIGHKEEDVVDITVPSGTLQYKILKISR